MTGRRRAVQHTHTHTHIYPRQYTQHAPVLFSHWFLLSFLCLLNNRRAQRHIVFSDLLTALKTHSILHSLKSQATSTTRNCVFVLFIYLFIYPSKHFNCSITGEPERKHLRLIKTNRLFRPCPSTCLNYLNKGHMIVLST